MKQVPAARKLAVIGEAFGESHGNARTHRGCHSHQKCCPGIARGEGRRKQWRERGNRAIHKPNKARLNNLQQEEAALRLAFLNFYVCGQVLVAKPRRKEFMFLFGFSQLAEKLGNQRVLAMRGCLFVEAVIFQLNDFHPISHGINIELADHPGGFVFYKSVDLAPPYQRNEIAELLLVKVGVSQQQYLYCFLPTISMKTLAEAG